MRVLRGLVVAVQFMTRVPVPSLQHFEDRDLAYSVGWYPAIGAVLGATIGGLGLAIHTLGAPPLVAACLTCFAGIVLTGALHEDGAADTADALGGGVEPEVALRILRDSRIGTYGALALIGLVLSRIACLAALPPTSWWWVLLLAHTVGRWMAVMLMLMLPYARPDASGLAAPMIRGIGTGTAIFSSLTVAVAVLLAGPSGLLGWAAGAVLVLVLGRWYRRRLGGITGDLCGAGVIAGELAVFLLYVLLAAP